MPNTMKAILLSLLTATVLIGCKTSPTGQFSKHGGKQDNYGCTVASNTTWSHLKQQCVKLTEVADIQFEEQIQEKTTPVHVILSEDKYYAEVFVNHVSDDLILKSVKGGYISDDNKIRLMKPEKGWKLLQAK